MTNDYYFVVVSFFAWEAAEGEEAVGRELKYINKSWEGKWRNSFVKEVRSIGHVPREHRYV